MLLLSSLQLLSAYNSCIIVTTSTTTCTCLYANIYIASWCTKGQSLDTGWPPQIRNKASWYRSLTFARPLLLPAKIIWKFCLNSLIYSCTLWYLFWLNHFEFLIHLKKHQNLMTLAQNIIVGVHIICDPFLFWLPHTAELCLHWSPYLRISFWPCSLLNMLSIFPLIVLYPTKPCTVSNSIIVTSVAVS